MRSPLIRRAAVVAILLLPAVPAPCQPSGLAGQDRIGAAPFGSRRPSLPEEPARAPRAALAPLTPVAQPWPRLEAGAVLCRTQEDLRRHAAGFGDPAAPPAQCSLIGRATPIAILQRSGPGATEVRETAPGGETGWTDAFLPDKAPGH